TAPAAGTYASFSRSLPPDFFALRRTTSGRGDSDGSSPGIPPGRTPDHTYVATKIGLCSLPPVDGSFRKKETFQHESDGEEKRQRRCSPAQGGRRHTQHGAEDPLVVALPGARRTTRCPADHRRSRRGGQLFHHPARSGL